VRGLFQLLDDLLQHAVDVAEHIVIPEAQNAISRPLKEFGSSAIGLFPNRMLPTIDLNHQTVIMADEIGNEPINRHLSPKLDPLDLGIPTFLPEQFLGIGRAASQSPRYVGLHLKTRS
jgi:hypothetical protein